VSEGIRQADGRFIAESGLPKLFLDQVDACVQRHGYCVVAVSEGIRQADGRFIAESGLTDAFGHAQLGGVAPVLANLVKSALGYKYHWAVADYLQRAARHLASAVDVEQAWALGARAVELALAGHGGVMPTIVRLSDVPYQWTLGMAALEDVANVEKFMPREFISAEGFHITDACRRYLAPLIQGEAWPPFVNGLPHYVRLQNRAVPRQLPPFSH
jgi:6-phosphofructokinase 1